MRAILLSAALLSISVSCVGLAATAPPCLRPAELEERKKLSVGAVIADGERCTGTLLAPSLVLTAARCVDKVRPDRIRFTVAARIDEPRAPSAKVAKVIVHPSFRAGTTSLPAAADLALLVLEDTNYGPIPKNYYDIADGADSLTAAGGAYLVGYGMTKGGTVGDRHTVRFKYFGEEEAALSSTEVVAHGLFVFVRGDDGDLPCSGDTGAPVLKSFGGESRIVGVHGLAAFRNRKDRKGNWMPIDPQRRCRDASEAIATALGPYLRWVREQRVPFPLPPEICGGAIPVK